MTSEALKKIVVIKFFIHIMVMWEYESRYADFERILDFHVRFEWIRPFADYNGRMGRMLMVKECLCYSVDLLSSMSNAEAVTTKASNFGVKN